MVCNAGAELGRFSGHRSSVFEFLAQTPDRVRMTDWYDTTNAHQVGFRARSVVGGVYIKMLADPKLWNEWAGQSNPVPALH